MHYRKLLVIADRPEEQPGLAVTRARAVAEPDAAIQVYSFVHDAMIDDAELYAPEEIDKLKRQLLDERRAWLDELLAGQAGESVQLTGKVIWEYDVAGWVNEHTAESPCDLVIKTGHRSESLWYTPTDWRLMRECQAPVYIGCRNTWRKQSVILATVDIATSNAVQIELNDKVLGHARRMAEALQAELHLVYAVPVSQFLLELEAFDRGDYRRRFDKKHARSLHELAGRFGIDESRVHVRVGPPPRVIPGIAHDLKAELVVLGSSGKRGLFGRLLGNTVEQTMHVLRTDVLSVRP